MGWSEAQDGNSDPKLLSERWKIYAYLSILTSYIKEETRKFFLGHTATNILIDDEGSITAIFDPELASTLLFHVAERYPLLLAGQN